MPAHCCLLDSYNVYKNKQSCCSKVWSVIRFIITRHSAAEITDNCVKHTIMNKMWSLCCEFKKDQLNVHDDKRNARLAIKLSHWMCENKIKLFNYNLVIFIEFAAVSKTTLFRTVTNTLQYHKLCAWWVLIILKNAHKGQRLKHVCTFLDSFHRKGEQFFSHIVTGDKTCILYM